MKLYDAHCHALPTKQQHSAAYYVLNGTSEDDWGNILQKAKDDSRIIPSLGLHPWFIDKRKENWKETLGSLLTQTHCAIGEIGIDKSKKQIPLSDQMHVFKEQLLIAQENKFPAAIHCVKAFGTLLEILSEFSLESSGFLMHSYGGGAEHIENLVKKGAYFSLPPKLFINNKEKTLQLLNSIPRERLLIESDTPSSTSSSQESLPLFEIYDQLAKLQAAPLESFAAQIEENFFRLFGKLINP